MGYTMITAAEKPEVKLNLGCGNKRKTGFLGVDLYSCAAVDVLANLVKPLPFDDSCAEEIWLDNVIEHIPDIPALMREIYRIGRPGARITIITPHFASLASWRDPTHVHHLSYFSMEHFERGGVAHYTGGGFRVLRRKLSFGGLLGNLGRLIFLLSPSEYEKNWCFILRPGTLTFELEISKEKGR